MTKEKGIVYTTIDQYYGNRKDKGCIYVSSNKKKSKVDICKILCKFVATLLMFK